MWDGFYFCPGRIFAAWVKIAVLGIKHLETWFNTTVCCGEICKSRSKNVDCPKETGCGHV